ncbi:MAG TPA: universal stress protein [Burkholderiaceae bacterium]|nr:universal stress protein [Burkholderiaceae bacterium]
MSRTSPSLLLATEHSEYDAGAERVALDLARRTGQPLAIVVPIVTNPEFEASAPDVALRGDQDAAARVAALRAAAARAGVDVAIEVRRADEAWRAIVAAARMRAADRLVVRRRGRRGFLAQLLVGEMVNRVAANAPCGVLFVPREAASWTGRVIAAIDESSIDTAGSSALRMVAAAATEAARGALPLLIIGVIARDLPAPRDRMLHTLDLLRTMPDVAALPSSIELRIGRIDEAILGPDGAGSTDLIVICRRTANGDALAPAVQAVIGKAQGAVLVTAN